MKQLILILFLLALAVPTIHAQWESLPGPYGGWANNFYAEDSIIYVASTSVTSTIYRSLDFGHHWEKMDLGLPDNIFYLRILYKKDSLLFVELEISDSGNNVLLYFSRNQGKTFDLLFDSADYSVAAIADTLYVSRDAGYRTKNDTRSLIKTSDAGKSWTDISPTPPGYFSQLKSFGKDLYVIRSLHGIFDYDWQLCRSRDGGKTWDSLFGIIGHGSSEMYQPEDYCISTIGADTSIWLAIDSMDIGDNRYPKLINISLKNDSVMFPSFPTKSSKLTIDTVINQFQFINGRLFAADGNQIYEFSPSQSSWQVLTDKIPRFPVDRITSFFSITKTNEFLLTFDLWSRWNSGYTRGVYRTKFGGANCIPSDTGIIGTETIQLLWSPDRLFSLTAATGNPLYYSVDHGESWVPVSLPFDIHGYEIYSMFKSQYGLFFSNQDSVFLLGQKGLISSNAVTDVWSFTQIGKSIYAWNDHFYRSDDSGSSWIKLTKPPLMSTSGIANTVFRNSMLVGGDSIIISEDDCQTWNKVKGISYSYFMCHFLFSDQENIYASASFQDTDGYFSSVFRSTDAGKTWNLFLPKENFVFTNILSVRNKIFFTSENGIYRCNANGDNFISLFPSQKLKNSYAIETDSEYLFIGTSGNGIFRAKLSDVLNYTNGVSQPIQFENISQLPIFPNPASSTITISSSEPITKITIFDEKGEEIPVAEQNIRLIPAGATVDIRKLPAGVYFCKAETRSGVQSGKFVKE